MLATLECRCSIGYTRCSVHHTCGRAHDQGPCPTCHHGHPTGTRHYGPDCAACDPRPAFRPFGIYL